MFPENKICYNLKIVTAQCSNISGIDLLDDLILSGNSSSRNSSRSGFRRYGMVTSLVSVGIVALAYTLGTTNIMDVGYGMKVIILKRKGFWSHVFF